MPALKNNKILWLFLCSYVFLWGFVSSVFLSSVFPDSAQNFSWGHVYAWGYNEHPPLGAIFLNLVNLIFHNITLSAYIAGSFCLALSLWITCQIALRYIPAKDATAAVLISSLSYYYLCNFVLQYNQNSIMLPFWLASILFFIRAQESNKLYDWIILSIVSALSMLAKYESAIILFLEVFYLFLMGFNRKYFQNFLYAAIVFLLILTPHIIWMFETNFLTVKHAFRGYTHLAPWVIRHIGYPISCFLSQLLNLALPIVTLISALKMRWLDFDHNRRSSKNHILVYFSLAPLLLVSLISCFLGLKIRAEWGFPLLSLSVIGVFYFFRVSSKNLLSILKLVIALQLIIFIAYFSIEYFSGLFHGRLTGMHYPGKLIAKSAETEVEKLGYNKNVIKFIGGNGYQALYYLDAYYPGAPILIVDNSLKNSPWIIPTEFFSNFGMLIYRGCNPESHQEEILNKYSIISKNCINVPASYKWKTINMPFTLYMVKPKKAAFT